MKRFSCLLLFFISLFAKAQTDTLVYTGCATRISLITCSPGTELYSSFGHTAIRVVDSSRGTDLIFNYGTFDFNDPHFYTKFIRGKLLYFVSIDNFTDFTSEYQYEKRGIIEQVLNLSCPERQQLLSALNENAKEENKYYKYDFVHDNCTTRVRDIVARFCLDSLTTNNILPWKGVSFRNLIHECLDKAGQNWSKLGIDMLLGMPLDKKISNNEAMFLPDYLLKGFDSSHFGKKELVAGKITILSPAFQTSTKSLFTPLIVFGALFVITALLGFSQSKRVKIYFRIFDPFFFFLCGAIGVWILFMWLGTDHLTCRNNLNLLWALPTHLPLSFLLHKKAAWVRNYFQVVFWISIALLLSWFFLPQQMNPALMFITGMIAVRSYYLSKKS